MSTKTRSGGVGTNADFAYHDSTFQRWCKAADVVPTKRQASKFRRQVGAAYRTMKGHMPPKVKESA